VPAGEAARTRLPWMMPLTAPLRPLTRGDSPASRFPLGRCLQRAAAWRSPAMVGGAVRDSVLTFTGAPRPLAGRHRSDLVVDGCEGRLPMLKVVTRSPPSGWGRPWQASSGRLAEASGNTGTARSKWSCSCGGPTCLSKSGHRPPWKRYSRGGGEPAGAGGRLEDDLGPPRTSASTAMGPLVLGPPQPLEEFRGGFQRAICGAGRSSGLGPVRWVLLDSPLAGRPTWPTASCVPARRQPCATTRPGLLSGRPLAARSRLSASRRRPEPGASHPAGLALRRGAQGQRSRPGTAALRHPPAPGAGRLLGAGAWQGRPGGRLPGLGRPGPARWRAPGPTATGGRRLRGQLGFSLPARGSWPGQTIRCVGRAAAASPSANSTPAGPVVVAGGAPGSRPAGPGSNRRLVASRWSRCSRVGGAPQRGWALALAAGSGPRRPLRRWWLRWRPSARGLTAADLPRRRDSRLARSWGSGCATRGAERFRSRTALGLTAPRR